MVRINLIYTSSLTDEHLRAEYNEILMFFGYLKKYPEAFGIPCAYCLGKGHIRFFKDKLLYLKDRFEEIKHEMQLRGFKTRKSVDISKFPKELRNDWQPSEKDLAIIKERLKEKINLKPDYYHYYGKKRPKAFLLGLIDSC
jgi:deoxyribonuclease (pyrimidine dimer)